MWVSLFSALIELDIISITNIFNIHQKKWVWRAVNFQTVPRPDLHKIPKEDDDCCGRHKQEPSGIEKNIMNAVLFIFLWHFARQQNLIFCLWCCAMQMLIYAFVF